MQCRNDGVRGGVGLLGKTLILKSGKTLVFSSILIDVTDIIDTENKLWVIIGIMNINLLKSGSHAKTFNYLDNIFFHGFLPIITESTRITTISAIIIDHIYANNF